MQKHTLVRFALHLARLQNKRPKTRFCSLDPIIVEKYCHRYGFVFVETRAWGQFFSAWDWTDVTYYSASVTEDVVFTPRWC